MIQNISLVKNKHRWSYGQKPRGISNQLCVCGCNQYTNYNINTGFPNKWIFGHFNYPENLGLYATKEYESGVNNPSYNKRYAEYKINESFFDKQTPESLWVLGFIFADGSLGKGYRIELTQKEPEILQKINVLMNSNYPITKRHNGGWSKEDIYRLRINSKRLYIALEKYGLHPNKSLDIKFPELDKSIINHFIRGYFDGDGSIYIISKIIKGKRYLSLRTKIIGSKKFINKLKSIIYQHYGINGSLNIIKRNKEVRYCTQKTKKLMDILYKESIEATRLDRKYKIFKNWRNGCES